MFRPSRPSRRRCLWPGPLPTGLKAVCIIAIVLGSLGILFSCIGAGNLVIGQSLQAAFNMPAPAGVEPDELRVQQELQIQLAAVDREYLPFLIASTVLHMLAGLALLLGGIFALKRSATGRCDTCGRLRAGHSL